MRTTQRCESMNRTLKTWLNKKVMLYRFVENYHKQLQSLRWEEGHQDYKSMDEQPHCDGVLGCLKQNATQVFMRNSYATLCKKISYEAYYLVKRCEDHNDSMCYWLEYVERRNGIL